MASSFVSRIFAEQLVTLTSVRFSSRFSPQLLRKEERHLPYSPKNWRANEKPRIRRTRSAVGRFRFVVRLEADPQAELHLTGRAGFAAFDLTKRVRSVAHTLCTRKR